ncbi:MAG: DNA polymerase domain-containing protein, partial [Pseudomonadota bacterium]
LLHWSRQWFESRGYRVLYGDTDSVFVASGEADAAHATSVGDDLVHAFNLELAEFLSLEYQVESRLELEFEKLYSRLFLASTRSGKQGARKRYAGIRYQAGADANTDEIEFVGMEVVRRDWTDLAKQVQRNLYQRLFAEADVTAYLSEVANLLRDGALDEQLVYRKGLRKSVDAYTTNVPPHVQAVRKSQQPPPRVVRYVMTRQGPELAAEQVHELDREHYLQRQVRPVAEPVLQALHLEFDKVVGDDRQTSLF